MNLNNDIYFKVKYNNHFIRIDKYGRIEITQMRESGYYCIYEKYLDRLLW